MIIKPSEPTILSESRSARIAAQLAVRLLWLSGRGRRQNRPIRMTEHEHECHLSKPSTAKDLTEGLAHTYGVRRRVIRDLRSASMSMSS